MNKFLKKAVDIFILVFLWILTIVFDLYFSVINFYFPSQTLHIATLLAVVSSGVLIVIYTRYWIKRWKE